MDSPGRIFTSPTRTDSVFFAHDSVDSSVFVTKVLGASSHDSSKVLVASSHDLSTRFVSVRRR